MQTIQITKNDDNKRLDKFLISFYNLPKSAVMKALRLKDVKVDGKRINDGAFLIKEGQTIVTYFKDVDTTLKFNQYPQTFKIIYEDKNILVVDKPSGLQMHAPSTDNLTDQVLTYLSKGKKIADDSAFIPASIHRLDKGTRGIVVFALNYQTLRYLQSIISDKEKITKTYEAQIGGRLEEAVSINKPLLETENGVIVAQGGKPSTTHVFPVSYDGSTTKVRVVIETGRKHQIRVHLASIGHPIIGDRKYGKKTDSDIKLTAKSIQFNNLDEEFSYLNGKKFAI